eukprot:jgi/Tetstr1/465289/TSEL_009989.t1
MLRLRQIIHMISFYVLATSTASARADQSQCGCLPADQAEDCAHVLLATPCYTGSVTDTYLLSVARTFQYFACSHVQIHVATVPGIADLPKARGALLYQEKYKYIFFIDADVEWHPEMMARFLNSGHDVVAGMYPKKQLDWQRLVESARASPHLPLDELKSSLLEYPIEFEFEDGNPETVGQVQTDGNGMGRVRRAGAAFMMVTRPAVNRLAAAYPELAYLDPPSQKTHYGLFYNGFTGQEDQRRWVSEDFAFCDRWRQIGGSVWVDLTSGLNHTGSIKYEGAHWIRRFQTGAAPNQAHSEL